MGLLPHNPALIGAAGEHLVAAELMRRGAHVSVPSYDRGVDLIAYHESGFTRSVPIQVKARAGFGYNFQRAWFEKAPGLVLVHVWHLRCTPEHPAPEFYIFADLADVERALGDSVNAAAWRVHGGFSATTPAPARLALMEPHRDQWGRILSQLAQT